MFAPRALVPVGRKAHSQTDLARYMPVKALATAKTAMLACLSKKQTMQQGAVGFSGDYGFCFHN